MHKYSKNPLRFYGLQWYSLNFLYNIDQALKMQNDCYLNGAKRAVPVLKTV